MHYVKRYVGYLIALALIVGVLIFVTSKEVSHVPPEHNQMAPTKKVDDWIFVTLRDRNDPAFEQGQIVRYNYRHPTYDEDDEIFMGRVLAREGERIAIRNGEVFVARAGNKIDYEKDKVPEIYLEKENVDRTLNFHEILVPRGCVFLMTDNRTPIRDRKRPKLYMADSRYLGPIPTRLITGTIDAD